MLPFFISFIANIARKRPELNRDKTTGIRVVFTSGYNTNITGPGGVLAGGDTVLAKPYRQHELAQSLRDALDS